MGYDFIGDYGLYIGCNFCGDEPLETTLGQPAMPCCRDCDETYFVDGCVRRLMEMFPSPDRQLLTRFNRIRDRLRI